MFDVCFYIFICVFTILINYMFYKNYTSQMEKLSSYHHDNYHKIYNNIFTMKWGDMGILLELVQMIRLQYNIIVSLLYNEHYAKEYLLNKKIISGIFTLTDTEQNYIYKICDPEYVEPEVSELSLLDMRQLIKESIRKKSLATFNKYISCVLNIYNMNTNYQYEGLDTIIEQFIVFKIKEIFIDKEEFINELFFLILKTFTKKYKFEENNLDKNQFREILRDSFDCIFTPLEI